MTGTGISEAKTLTPQYILILLIIRDPIGDDNKRRQHVLSRLGPQPRPTSHSVSGVITNIAALMAVRCDQQGHSGSGIHARSRTVIV